MASVRLTFLPPEISDLVALRIYEATAKEGAFSQIERTTSVGTSPYWINEYTTSLAASATDWFEIAWEDSGGAVSVPSAPIQGGTQTLVGILVERLQLRDSTINETVAAQEAEAAISQYFNIDDPYSIDPSTVSPKILQGLTLLSLAWTYTVTQVTSGSVQKFTAGLVSLDSGSSSSTVSKASIDQLMKLANNLLGRNFSTIMQLKSIAVAGGFKPLLTTVDLSRTIIEV